MYSNSLKRITVDFALLSTSQEKKVRFGETKIHPQDRGPGILFGGFIILQSPLDRLWQHDYYSRSAYNIYSIFCICKHDDWLSREGKYPKVLSKGYILGFCNLLRSSKGYHFIKKNKRGKNPYSMLGRILYMCQRYIRTASLVGGGFRMGNTCKSMADSCQCMAKTTPIL